MLSIKKKMVFITTKCGNFYSKIVLFVTFKCVVKVFQITSKRVIKYFYGEKADINRFAEVRIYDWME